MPGVRRVGVSCSGVSPRRCLTVTQVKPPPTSPEVVRTDVIVLRPYGDADVPHLEAAFCDEAIAAWNPGPAAPTTAANWARDRNDWGRGGHASWAIGDDDGGLLGSVSLHQIDWEQADAEIGYWVAPWARGRGVASAAVAAATDYAFGRLELHRVYLFHAVDNIGSCGVAQ